jgi:folate-binding protein YgfZ
LAVLRRDWSTLAVTGPDAKPWLNAVVTCDVAKLRLGQGTWGLLLTRHGKILSDLQIICDKAGLYVSVAESRRERVHRVLADLLVMEDAELGDVTSDWVWWELVGRRAADAAQELAIAHSGVAASLDRTGKGGGAVLVSRRAAEEMAEGLRAGRWPGIVLSTDSDWELVRVESGLPTFGVDYGPDERPHEASLESRAVSWTKGCYLGQEVVCMQGRRGKVKRRVAALVLDSQSAPAAGAAVTTADSATIVGRVTSSAFSPTLKRALALAQVQVPHESAGTKLMVGSADATVVERPV